MAVHGRPACGWPSAWARHSASVRLPSSPRQSLTRWRHFRETRSKKLGARQPKNLSGSSAEFSAENIRRNCASSAVASGQKFRPAECECTRLARFILRAVSECNGTHLGASGADDLVGGAEDFLGALFRYCFRIRTTPTAEPVLYIAASIIGSLKAQRFATK